MFTKKKTAHIWFFGSAVSLAALCLVGLGFGGVELVEDAAEFEEQ